ncbi:MAG: hypothetical protein ACR2MO_06575 [Acidimicrobiales bacterium]
MPSDSELEVLKLQFETTYDAMKTFFDWRHHIFTRFFVGVGAVAVAWQWLNNTDLRLQSMVLALAAVFSRMMALSDRVNGDHIRHLYELGARIERTLPGALDKGVFATIDRRPRKAPNWWQPVLWLVWAPSSTDDVGASRLLRYSSILRLLYNGAALVFLSLLVINFVV